MDFHIASMQDLIVGALGHQRVHDPRSAYMASSRKVKHQY